MAPNVVQSFASIRVASWERVLSRFCFKRRIADFNELLRTRVILERGSSSLIGGAIAGLFLFFFFFFFFVVVVAGLSFNFLNIPDHTDPTILFTNGNCLWSSKVSITVCVCVFASSSFSEFETESTYLSLSPLRRLNTPLRNARGTSHSLLSMPKRIRPIQQQACVILFHLCLCLLCKLHTTVRCPPCGYTSCVQCPKSKRSSWLSIISQW